ncbi:SagB family peptide dehydrogenase [Beijerinckia mobilis]|uniref:SagB family peptide dehydrogenase n=1 Tax=Beijerinckia mobilis TaxID=231434 RepID=UPI0006924D24|nr:SagB family peptide dehydrogenase [Beijerinckia mobilis]
MTTALPPANAADVILAYHQRTKHKMDRYAAGPETLDWSEQPNPFRSFAGAEARLLPLSAEAFTTPFSDIYNPERVAAAPFDETCLGALLQLSMALNAWKEYGPDRWAMRSNPSSGNLHPTEAYVLARGIPGLADGVHHYTPTNHGLELRCPLADTPALSTSADEPALFIGLSSIHWREAWKYGERAFRYCQLDVGHAIGALRYAAGTLGWHLRMVEGLTSGEIAQLLGLDRDGDFSGGAEREAPDIILRVVRTPTAMPIKGNETDSWLKQLADWRGKANVLDRHHMYKWPVIDEASAATKKTEPKAEPHYRGNFPGIGEGTMEPAPQVILNRRSAQAFDRTARMGSGSFYHLIDRLLARAVAPWDVWSYKPRLHPVFFIHRVDGLEPGLYILLRNADAEMRLKQATHQEFAWKRPEHVPPQLNFFQLLPTDCTKVARTLHCHQAIAADSCFALGMLAEFDDIVRDEPWRYKQLHWEAGLIGQVLYLEAETLGFRGTGIGCFFDDAMHEILGLKDAQFATLYHFTVGLPLIDTRMLTLPPYGERTISTASDTAPTEGQTMAEEASFERIGIDTARQLLADERTLVLDVRDPGSYESGHIEGAEHATEANLFHFLSTTPKDTPVLIYCYHGNSSQVYAKTFADFRFKSVYSLDGGYEGWRKANG